jgi:hypothetical protein
MSPAGKIEIVIKDVRTPKWLRALIAMSFLVFFPICLGIYAGSSAMQWAGFFFGVLCSIALAKEQVGQKAFNSPADARAYLDGIIHKEQSNG